MANVFGTGTTTGQTGTQTSGSSNNQLVVSRARAAMDQLKQQTAAELGIHNYDQQYKGDLPSRVNGSVGGYMVKKMIAIAESQLAGGATGAIGSAGTIGTTSTIGTTGTTGQF